MGERGNHPSFDENHPRKTFEIRKNEAGQRFDKYLKKLLSKAPSGFIYKMLRKKNITLNKRKAEGSERLNTGDEIRLFLSEETIESFFGNSIQPAADSRPEAPQILFP